MILPGLISLAFYRRSPTAAQVALGLIATVALSAVLGYYSPAGALGRDGSVIVAIIGGVVLYVVILLVMVYYSLPKHAKSASPAPPVAPP